MSLVYVVIESDGFDSSIVDSVWADESAAEEYITALEKKQGEKLPKPFVPVWWKEQHELKGRH